MDIILSQPFPYKSLDFMSQYFTIYNQFSHRVKIATFKWHYFLLTFKALQYFLFFLTPPNSTSIITQFLLNDIVQLVDLPGEVNLIIVGNLILAGYFIYLLIFDNRDFINGFYFDLLIRRFNNGFFIENKRIKSGKDVVDYIRLYCFIVLNLLQIFIIAIDLFILISQYYGLKAMFQLPVSLPELVLYIILAELNILLFYLALFAFSYSHMLMATYAFVLLEIFRILLLQLGRLMQRNLTVFRSQYTRALVQFCKINHFAGAALLPLLLVNCPANAVMVITLLTRPLVIQVQFFLLMVIIEQFLCIFLVHLLVAHLNGRYKYLAKRFIPLIYSSYPTAIKQKLLNQIFFEKFHTKKQYGITYRKFGNISMLNFVKYLALYSELLLVVYKIFVLY